MQGNDHESTQAWRVHSYWCVRALSRNRWGIVRTSTCTCSAMCSSRSNSSHFNMYVQCNVVLSLQSNAHTHAQVPTNGGGGLPAANGDRGGAARMPAAVVEAGYLCDNNQALADLLFGVENRWGKLAYTIYSQAFALHENPMPTASECGCDGSPATYRRCVECSIGYLNMSMRATARSNSNSRNSTSSSDSNNPGRGHRYYTGKPQFPFGFGLSLTPFSLLWHHDGKNSNHTSAINEDVGNQSTHSAPSLKVISAKHKGMDAALAEYTVDVTNTGTRSGDEVVFMYCQPATKNSVVLPAAASHNRGATSHAQIPIPNRKLVGFQRYVRASARSFLFVFN